MTEARAGDCVQPEGTGNVGVWGREDQAWERQAGEEVHGSLRSEPERVRQMWREPRPVFRDQASGGPEIRDSLLATGLYRGRLLSEPAVHPFVTYSAQGRKLPAPRYHRPCFMSPPSGVRSLLREALITVAFRKPPSTALIALARLYAARGSQA